MCVITEISISRSYVVQEVEIENKTTNPSFFYFILFRELHWCIFKIFETSVQCIQRPN